MFTIPVSNVSNEKEIKIKNHLRTTISQEGSSLALLSIEDDIMND